MKKIIAIFTAAVTALSVLAGCGTAEESVNIRIGTLSGPTAMGMVKLMDDSEAGNTENSYIFSDPAADASALVAPLASGELDIAALPSNLAATLYNNTDGQVQVLSACVLGVLYLVERGDTLNSMADLSGKTVFATGQGAVPEYIIRKILTSDGIDPDKDVDIRWCSDTTEALSYISATDGAIAVLPQPFVTAACAQTEDLRVVQDLNDAWEETGEDCSIVTGVIAVRKEFAEKYPDQLEKFLEEYRASVDYTSEDVEGAAALAVKYGIVAKEPLAEKAMPKCHIVCITGQELKDSLSGFLQTIYDQNPQAVGGTLPGDDFYYGS